MTKRIGLKFFPVPGTKQHRGWARSLSCVQPRVSLQVAEAPAAGESEMTSPETLPRTRSTPLREPVPPGARSSLVSQPYPVWPSPHGG